jgi:hypothetical protein
MHLSTARSHSARRTVVNSRSHFGRFDQTVSSASAFDVACRSPQTPQAARIARSSRVMTVRTMTRPLKMKIAESRRNTLTEENGSIRVQDIRKQ